MTGNDMDRLVMALDPHALACEEDPCLRCNRTFETVQRVMNLGVASGSLIEALVGTAHFGRVHEVLTHPSPLEPNDERRDDWSGDGYDWAALDRQERVA